MEDINDFSGDSPMATALDLAIVSALEALQSFSTQDNFWDLFETAFGDDYDRPKMEQIRTQWQAKNFEVFPSIRIISQDILGSAWGAYGDSTGVIYLLDTFVSNATKFSLVRVVLEEYGHFIDKEVNSVDSAGDEGAIFSALARSEALDEVTLQQFKTEDDYSTILLNEQIIQIEQSTTSTQDQFDQQVLNLVNQYRTQNGLSGLILSQKLDQAADKYANRMATGDFVDHYDPNGSTPFTRMLAEGYQYTTGGENIAAGYTTPESVVQEWIDSPGHRANILKPNYRHIGNENYQHYWVQNFGAGDNNYGIYVAETTGSASDNKNDLNQDGKADILVHNPSRNWSGAWLMNGTNYSGWAGLPDWSGWRPVGMGDFNSDGKTDVLINNPNNRWNGVWRMNGTSYSGYTGLAAGGWNVVSAGDFNKDNRSDIVVHNPNNFWSGVWLMNGTNITGWIALPAWGGWKPVATGDFNKDGNLDVLINNASQGWNGIWYTNGSSYDDRFSGWESDRFLPIQNDRLIAFHFREDPSFS